jgi:hypothetical protein
MAEDIFFFILQMADHILTALWYKLQIFPQLPDIDIGNNLHKKIIYWTIVNYNSSHGLHGEWLKDQTFHGCTEMLMMIKNNATTFQKFVYKLREHIPKRYRKYCMTYVMAQSSA